MATALSTTNADLTDREPLCSPVIPSTEMRILLEGVSWETFERLLEETGASRNKRFAYRDGILEIMVPFRGHEEPTRLFDQFLVAIIDELNLEICNLGSLTMKDPQLKMGLEPDCCFYIQNEAKVRGVESLDFEIHPPPDLAIEVDNSNSSLNKFPIYVALKIPEIWRFRSSKLVIYHLNTQQSEYEVKEESLAFPKLPIHALPQFIELAKDIGQRAAVRELARQIRQVLAEE